MLVDSRKQQGTPPPHPRRQGGEGWCLRLMLMLFLKPSFLSCLAFDPCLVETGRVN